ncbi:MAG: G1 family glutamic endopeptidase [Candidatus Nanopelagicales bacterium]
MKKPPPRRDSKKYKPSRTDEKGANSDSQSGNWSGGAVASTTHKLVAAYAEWVVPTVQRAPGDGDDKSPWKSSTWVGLDGSQISDDVLQAGTGQYVDIVGGLDTAHYYAWYEWYPFFEVRIDNFPVAPGDAMFVYVAFDGPDSLQVQYGHAWLVNLTSGIETSIYFPQPGPADLPAGFLGNTAECVMETPGFLMADGTIGQSNFPHFGEVAFVNFGACSDDGAFFGPDDFTTIALTSGLSDGELRRALVCKPL